MIYLLLSIVFSVITVSFFKLFEKYGVHTFSAIVLNYISCVILGNISGEYAVSLSPFYSEPWFLDTLVLGALFISIFMSIGLTAQKLGVSVSMLAAKLSVVVPVCVAFFLYDETITPLKLTGILLSMVAVYLISKKEDVLHVHPLYILLPVAVFAGSGMIDTLLKHVEKTYIPPANATSIVTTVFLMASVWGSAAWLVMKIAGKSLPLSKKEVVWGLALGLPNYFSMYFLVRTLSYFSEASRIFPINNIGIAASTTLVGVLIFHEKISRLNLAGIILAVIAIVLISFT